MKHKSITFKLFVFSSNLDTNCCDIHAFLAEGSNRAVSIIFAVSSVYINSDQIPLFHGRLRILDQQIITTMKLSAHYGTPTERRTSRTRHVSMRIQKMLSSDSSKRKSRCSKNSWKMAVVSIYITFFNNYRLFAARLFESLLAPLKHQF